MDFGIFKNVVDRVDQWLMDGSHYVGEERGIVGLDEDESGQTPNASHQSKR
jgi:hypothetical protein